MLVISATSVGYFKLSIYTLSVGLILLISILSARIVFVITALSVGGLEFI